VVTAKQRDIKERGGKNSSRSSSYVTLHLDASCALDCSVLGFWVVQHEATAATLPRSFFLVFFGDFLLCVLPLLKRKPQGII
jgi:hypothetical protein